MTCVFCDYQGPSPILDEDLSGFAFVIEPLDPVTPGHLLVIPRKHFQNAAEVPGVAGRVAAYALAYANCTDVESFNLITSVGAPATQTVRHLHWHIVPRQEGDGLALPWSVKL